MAAGAGLGRRAHLVRLSRCRRTVLVGSIGVFIGPTGFLLVTRVKRECEALATLLIVGS